MSMTQEHNATPRLRCVTAVHAGTYDNPACRSCQCAGRPREIRAKYPPFTNQEIRRKIAAEIYRPNVAADDARPVQRHVGGVHARSS